MLALLPALASSAIQLTRGQIFSGIGGCVAALPFACEAYARAPPWRSDALPKLVIDAERDDVVLVLHGAGGPDANSRRIVDAMQKRYIKAQVVEYVYTPFVGNQLQAPFNAMRVGDHLAEELLLNSAAPTRRRVHIVGISVGAFAADRLATRLAADGRCEQVKLTLLDPFTARGLLGLVRPESAYGVNNFGRAPRVVTESVFNRDDPVPSTNLPLRCAVNFDITNAATRTRFTPLPGDNLHSWPAAWYGLNPAALDERGAAALALGSVTPIP